MLLQMGKVILFFKAEYCPIVYICTISFLGGYHILAIVNNAPMNIGLLWTLKLSGPRKHHYKQSQWRWWKSWWAISNPKRWCCESAALNMSANLENSAVSTGLEKVGFHSNPKERKCQRMFKLQHNCTHLTHWQSNAQNSPSQVSTVCEPRTARCSSWI